MITPVGQIDRRRAFIRGAVIRCIVIVVLAVIAVLVLLTLFGDHSDLILRSAIAVAGLLIAVTLINSFASQLEVEDVGPSRRWRQGKAANNWPADLLEIEGRVSLSRVSAFDHQSRLRPLFRELATARLAANRNIDVTTQPDEALAVVGTELWREMRPPFVEGDLRELPGPTEESIRRMVEKIESI